MKAPYCETCKTVVEAVSYIPIGLDDDGQAQYSELGIVLNIDGKSTGRWSDGTRGTSNEQDQLAEDDEQPRCIQCGGEIAWVDKVKPSDSASGVSLTILKN